MKLKCTLFLTFAMIIEIPANSELSTILNDNFDSMNQASQNNKTEVHFMENVLCRGCGSDVSSNNFITFKLSPASLYSFNDTLFSKESVLVQVVSNDYVFQFPVIVFQQSTCVGIGELQILWRSILRSSKENMTSSEAISNDQIFLASCEELLKDRYTDKDEEFMKVFNAEPSMPPIVESWWVSNNSGRRNDRRFNRPYNRHGHDHRSRGYDNRNYGHHSNRPRY